MLPLKPQLAFRPGFFSSLLRFTLLPWLTGFVILQDSAANQQLVLRSASELDYPPLAIVTKEGEPTGFSVDLLKAVAAKSHLEVTIEVGPWEQIRLDLQGGKLDLLPLVGYSEERDRYFDFSVPYLRIHGAVFVRKEYDEIKSMSDLEGKTVIVMQGDIAHDHLLANPEDEQLLTTEDLQTAFGMLLSGKGDAVFAQQLVGEYLLSELNLKDKIRLATRATDMEVQWCMAVQDGNAELLAKINEGLFLAKADGTLDQLYEKWFLPDDFIKGIPIKYWLNFVLIIIGVVLLSALAAWWWQRSLIKAVNQRTRELNKANREIHDAKEAADSANRSKSEFLALMSHEIRTPMNGVLGMAEVLQMTLTDREHLEMVLIIKKSGRSLLRLIDDILDLSKIEAGMLEISEQPVNLYNILKETVDLHRSMAESKGLELSLSVSDHIPSFVFTDPLRMQQVMNNLLSNAIKFTDTGRIDLIVSEHRTRPDEMDVTFVVRDTGIGIAPERAHRLFEPFRQIDSGMARKGGGTGLGLAICKRLVERMGGGIAYTSEPGKGTEFSFSLPLRIATVDLPDQHDQPAWQSMRLADDFPLSILIVEDNENNQKVMHKLLQALGYTSDVAKNGIEALAMIHTKHYDLVFMDLQMPGMDGITATREIRRRQDFADVRIIAISAHVFEDMKQTCTEAGANGFIEKPVGSSDICDAIKSVFSK